MTPLVVVVLAGGKGRRMAGSKPGRRLAGRTLLDRALELAGGYGADIALSVRAPAQAGAGQARQLIDDPGLPGPLAGVASALAFARERGAPAVLTIPCDAPFLPADLASRLRAGMVEGRGAVLASSGGRPHPVCALWRAGLGEALRAYAGAGRASLIGLADHVGWTAVDWPADPVDPFFNVNTPADLARAESILGATPSLPRGSAPGG